MSLTIYILKKHKQTTAKKDDDSDVEDDFADDPEGNKQSDGKELDEKDDEGSVAVNYFLGKSFDNHQSRVKRLAAKESCHKENSALCCCTRESALGGRLGDVVNIFCCFELQCAHLSL
jgi:hypothetical protein